MVFFFPTHYIETPPTDDFIPKITTQTYLLRTRNITCVRSLRIVWHLLLPTRASYTKSNVRQCRWHAIRPWSKLISTEYSEMLGESWTRKHSNAKSKYPSHDKISRNSIHSHANCDTSAPSLIELINYLFIL